MKKDSRLYLFQILERIDRIQKFTKGGKLVFLEDLVVQDAVIRNLEVIGEAAKRASAEYRESTPEIPWKGLASLRDVLIHQYEGVSLEEVWGVVEKDLPEIKKSMLNILPPLDQLERELSESCEH
ncbi:MAG: DUF86 domain-containing protein [Desulfomonilaceae bacterium]